MGIVQVNGISLSFGERVLLNNVSLTLGEHARAALAGGNGEGKSTLMKVIAGLMPCDGGSVTCTRGTRISYLPQSDIVLRGNTVYEEIEKGFSRWRKNLERQHEIEEILSSEKKDGEVYGSSGDGREIARQGIEKLLLELDGLQEELLDGPYYRRREIIFSVAGGLGLSEADMERPCSGFSGGYQMRIALARVLVEDPDVMLLDEPTNYLDIEARLWLRDYLGDYKGALLIVCHDKGFLDSTVNEVYELFNSRLTRYSGNYSFYEKQRRLELEQLEAAYKRQQAEIGRTEQFIERFRYKATKARQVQSRVKMLEKLEPVVVPSHLKSLHFAFPEPPHSPNDVVVVENLTKKYGELVVFDNFSMLVAKGQRLAVTGHNGIGKSTLLRIIAGQDRDFSGTVRLGTGVVTGYYSQDTADSLDMDGTVFSQVEAYGTEGRIRNALGAFLFSGDDIKKRASVLSGGERSRLALLKILLNPASLLILDEPTNHLDINAKDMLLEALKAFKGTMIFVSHDAYFIRALADRILYLSEGKPEFFNGDYDYFEWKMSRHAEDGTRVKPMKNEARGGISAENGVSTKSKVLLEGRVSDVSRVSAKNKVSSESRLTDASRVSAKGRVPSESEMSGVSRTVSVNRMSGINRSASENRVFDVSRSASENRAEENRRRNRIRKLEREVAELFERTGMLETEITNIKEQMDVPENYSNAEKITALAARLAELETGKDEAETLWLEKTAELEDLTNMIK